MGISSSLYIAITGMSLSQAGMGVASHNIANVNTPGYSRQRLNLETNPTWKGGAWGQMGTGVSAQNISRYHDEFLTRNIINKSADYMKMAAQKGAMDAVESFFNESDGKGVNAAMNDFWALWDSVADAAELTPPRKELVAIAKTMADQLKYRRADLDAVRKDLNERVEAGVRDVNKITKQIAILNQQIMAMEDPSRNQQANDLRDARESLLTQLSELVSVDWWEDPSNGAVNVTIPLGPALVMTTSTYPMSAAMDQSGDLRVLVNNRPGEPEWEEDVTKRLSGGALGGWTKFRDVTLRQFYLEFETFADNFIFQTNNQHAQGTGLELLTQSNATNFVSNHPSQKFSFNGMNNDLRLTALVPHLSKNEPYVDQHDPDNIAVRFVKATDGSSRVSSSVNWNDDPGVKKWEITITLPVDSKDNITATAEDVIRHINDEKSATPNSGVPHLPPIGATWPYKIGDFIGADSAFGDNWNGKISFTGSSFPTGYDEYIPLDRSLANTTPQGHHLSYGSEYASLTTSLKHTDNDVTFTAVDKGAAGEKISIEYVAGTGASQLPSVTVYTDIDGTKRVSVTLGTDADGNTNTTAADIVSLINKDQATRDLIYAETPKDQSGLGLVKEMDSTYLDRSGYFEIVVYDELDEPSIYRVTVDPTDTLQDVADRIGDTFGSGSDPLNPSSTPGIKGVRAEIITDMHGKSTLKLIADSESGYKYGFRNDSSGALAVLGINNIFTGSSSATVDINHDLVENPDLLAAGRISSDGKRAPGNGDNALDMADLKDKRFIFKHVGSATMGTAYNTFYSGLGATGRNITQEHDFQYGMLSEMHDRQDTLAGVNLDEELSDILRFQYMYQASAKMISTIDDMMQSLLAIR